MQILKLEKNVGFLRKYISSFCFIVFAGLETDKNIKIPAPNILLTLEKWLWEIK